MLSRTAVAVIKTKTKDPLQQCHTVLHSLAYLPCTARRRCPAPPSPLPTHPLPWLCRLLCQLHPRRRPRSSSLPRGCLESRRDRQYGYGSLPWVVEKDSSALMECSLRCGLAWVCSTAL